MDHSCVALSPCPLLLHKSLFTLSLLPSSPSHWPRYYCLVSCHRAGGSPHAHSRRGGLWCGHICSGRTERVVRICGSLKNQWFALVGYSLTRERL